MTDSRQSSVISRQRQYITRQGILLKADDCRLSTAQRGFTLAGLLVILTVLAVVLAFTVPTKWSDVRNRERDRQLMFVLEQYARAIEEYQRRSGGLPTSLEQLEEFNNPRVLRQLYVNPLSGEVDWILVPPGTEGGPGAPGQVDPNQPGGGGETAGQRNETGQRGPGDGGGGEYVGPFVGVRPPQTGESYLEFNGSNRYEEWIFTLEDLRQQGAPPGQGGEPQPGEPGTKPGG